MQTINNWPNIEKKLEENKIAIQINGKTRDIITIKKDLVEKDVNKIIIVRNQKQKNILTDKKIIKTIFVKKIKL